MTNPECQRKLHVELSKVIGSDRMITLDDKTDLPYVNAVVAETQRLCNLLPFNIPRRLLADVDFQGYHLKANTIVVPQISSVLYDEKVFPDPTKFKPERFLDSDGKFQTKPELIPFSVGKRACLGESLARLELYLFAANLFNHFEVGFNLEMKTNNSGSFLDQIRVIKTRKYDPHYGWHNSTRAICHPTQTQISVNFDIKYEF